MGATTFEQTVLVRGDVKEAYRLAREEAAYENGHRHGYSGDIQTTSGYIDFSSVAPRYGTKKFYKWVEDHLFKKDEVEKWHKCGAVEIKGEKFKTLKKWNGLDGKRGYRAFYFFGCGAE